MSTSDSSLPRHLPRRALGRLAATAAALPALHSTLSPDGARGATGGRLRLRRDPGSVVSALDVHLDGVPGAARSIGALRTPSLETTPFSMVGVTWRAGSGSVRVRARRTRAGWTPWQQLGQLHDRPEVDEADGTPHATDLAWFGEADAVQVEIRGTAKDPVLALIDPGRREQDKDLDRFDRRHGLARRTEQVAGDRDRTPRPRLKYRSDWGADPRLRDGTQVVSKRFKQVHLHHTVSSNDYGKSDVPAMIRGMYRYHTQSLGWSDIGYNFLIDKFGRIWVGRKDSADKLVRGAHTLGFNHNSMGVSVIGNFEVKKPNVEIIAAVARLAAWRIDKWDLPPRGTVLRTSTGSDRYPAGTKVRLPVIDGHRDTNQTACPGKHLYDALPRIRRRTRRRIRRFNDLS